MGKLAISGAAPVRKREFPKWPVYGKEEEENLKAVLYKSKWGIGKRTGVINEFEQKFSTYHNRKFGVSCTNCSHALQIMLAVSGISAGDEVIVPSYSFIATASAAVQLGAAPVFADVSRDNLCIDAESIEQVITKKTKAVMPVHFAGHFSNMKKLTVIAKKHNIILIEDAAQAHGARWDGDYAGGRSRGAGFSFQYSKNMTSGEGGIIVSDSGDFTEACWEYIWHGRKKGGIWYEHFKATSNYRMTEWQAAVLLAQLDRLSEQNNIRDLNGKFLDRELGKIEGIESLKVSPLTEIHPRHLYIFRIKDKDIPKERFIKALNAEGIPALPGYGFPLYKNPAFLGKGMDYSKVYNENSEAACKEVVWILHNALLGTEEDMLDIVNAVKKIMANKDEL